MKGKEVLTNHCLGREASLPHMGYHFENRDASRNGMGCFAGWDAMNLGMGREASLDGTRGIASIQRGIMLICPN